MSIVEQCAIATGELSYIQGLEPCEIPLTQTAAYRAVAEFARLAQSLEMVERIVNSLICARDDGSHKIVRKVLAALFREAGVSGGEG